MHENKGQVAPISYNLDDAALALGISKRSIYNLIDDGKLRKVKVGRRTLIPASDLSELIHGVVA